MSLLSNLMSKVFGGVKKTAASYGDAINTIKDAIIPPPNVINPVDASASIGVPPLTPDAPVVVPEEVIAAVEVPVVAPEPVDVTAILDGMAAAHKEKLDWKRSIVDLMKLVGMDSSLSERKELAKELGYSGDFGDSAKMNVWLHKQVLLKISENGGILPEDLLS
jgi:hypothetical protein